MSDRTILLEKGLQQCQKLMAEYPKSAALRSVAKQIEYLLALERGVNTDRSRLSEITIGVLTVREIEPLDNGAAETFYKIASLARNALAKQTLPKHK